MKGLFSIGELSAYQNISRQTLIYYDKIGLFRPAYVDPDTGYRYYSPRQIDYLDTILIMKKIGFSLKQIRAHMEHYTLESSLQALRAQASEIERRIAEWKLIQNRVELRCRQMEAAREVRGRENEVVLEQVPGQTLLVQPVAPPYTLEACSIATKRCFALAFSERLPLFFESGAIVPRDKLLAGRFMEAAYAFVPLEGPSPHAQSRVLPAGRCACVYHVGDYPSIGRAYRRLMAFLEAQGLEAASDAYEVCINDYLTSRDESEYITRIQVYVREKR